MKERIRPLYSELKGYFNVIPDKEFVFDDVSISLAGQFNGVIDELNSLSETNYDKFKVNTKSLPWGATNRTGISIIDYRSKLSGIISRLQGEFFSEEQIVPANSPSTIINASQTQSQAQSMGFVLDIHERIISEIPKHQEGTKERTFLEKMKSALASIKTTVDVFSIALKLGAELGIDPLTIHKLLGL